MYVRTYVRMYALMHACMHACMYICIYIYIYMYTYLFMCVYIYIYIYIVHMFTGGPQVFPQTSYDPSGSRERRRGPAPGRQTMLYYSMV